MFTPVTTSASMVGDVAPQARHHVAQLTPLEEAQRKALHVREQVDAQIQDELFADPGGQILIDR
jgi:hypothetical protein